MALLRIRTPEQLQGQPPGELGILLGLDRAPEVKTLRRKLAELAARRQATPFSQRLAERWVRDQADAVGLLYVDGHVRPYHGTTQTLPEAYVTRRRLCMPATTDVWVQQQDAQPLFVVTAPANDDLRAMLRRAILTTRTDLPIAVVAYRMFERWTQENFFRYMRQHFALDALLTYAVEPADPDRTIPNPARKALRKQLAEARVTLKALEQEYGHAAQKNPEGRRPTMRGFKMAHGALGQQIRAQERECHRFEVQLAALPERVPINAVMDEGEIVKLAPEAKHLTDTIKMVAYRAETALVRCLAPHYAKTEDEGRALIREMLSSSADFIPEAQRLRIRLHSLANPRSNQALAHVCATLNALELQYPWTTLTLVFEAPWVA